MSVLLVDDRGKQIHEFCRPTWPCMEFEDTLIVEAGEFLSGYIDFIRGLRVITPPVMRVYSAKSDLALIDEDNHIDDTLSRASIWKALFDEEPLPEVEENAVEKCAGSLDKYLPDNVPVERIVRHAKG